MPRASRKRAAADAAPTPAAAAPVKQPLDGLHIALSGTFKGVKQTQITDHILALGASFHREFSDEVTHLIASNADFDKKSAKVAAAEDAKIPILTIYWIQDCASQNSKIDETRYLFPAAGSGQSYNTHWTGTLAAPPKQPFVVPISNDDEDDEPPAKKAKADDAAVTKKSTRGKKAPVVVPISNDDEDEDKAPAANGKAPATKAKADDATDTKKSARGKKAKTDTASQSQDADQKADTDKAKKGKEKVESVVNGVVKAKNVHIPIDEGCTLPASYTVYIDDAGLVWDASLNQTNAGNNNNKFYRLQLLRNKNDYKTWSRWGRVGVHGQSAVLGSGSLADAQKQFEKKFKDKSGLRWEDRLETARPGKYTFIERSYDPDSDDDDKDAGAAKASKEEDDSDGEPPALCTLDPRVEALMTLMFNKAYFAATMSDLNYDANKLPLGKLAKNTIVRGFQTLKDLAALLDDNTLAQSKYYTDLDNAIANLSNAYYSLIPHAFGFNRPPVIKEYTLLKKEIELLESLGDMKDAELIMKVAANKRPGGIHPLDESYNKLGMKEMTPLAHKSTEFKELSAYLNQTKGSTHNMNYAVEDIFRIERNGEFERFEKSIYGPLKGDRRLLWHGSRVTNFGGILGQGLRIAPPEAPVSGYMFGKGVYLADMSSKSAGYCCHYLSGNTALLLLCEAELGDPMQKLVNASYNAGEDAKKQGMHSTWGQGSTGPSKWKDAGCVHPSLKGTKMPDVKVAPGPTNVQGAGLYYNEYIAYDVSQIRLRYLFRVKM